MKRIKIEEEIRIVSSTSQFRKQDIENLNIVFKGRDKWFDDININYNDVPQYFYINNEEITGKIKEEYSKEEKTIVSLVKLVLDNEKVASGTSESNTDSFVNYLLGKLGFNEYPYILRLQSDYKFDIHDNTVKSIPEFSVEKEGMVILIDEDKHLKNVNPRKHYGEWQIAGEIVAVACTNYDKKAFKGITNTGEIIYCIRVIGTKFTFYKCFVSIEYIESLANGFPSTSITIERYPNNHKDKTFSHYDYVYPDQRSYIIDVLFKLKSTI